MNVLPIVNFIYRDRPNLTGKLSPSAKFVRNTPAFDSDYKRVEPNIPRLSQEKGLILSGPLTNGLINSNDFTTSNWRLISTTVDGVFEFSGFRLTKVRGTNITVDNGVTATASLFHNFNIYTEILAKRQWRISALAKAGTGDILVIEINNGEGYTKLKYDLKNGLIVGSSSRFKADIRHLRDGVYEISLHDSVGFANPDFGSIAGSGNHPFGFQLNKKGVSANSYPLENGEDSDSVYVGNIAVTYVDYYPGVFYSYAHSEGDSMRAIAGEKYEQEIDSISKNITVVAELSVAGPVTLNIFGYSHTLSVSKDIKIEVKFLSDTQASIVINDATPIIHDITNNSIAAQPLDGGNCTVKSIYSFL